MIIGVPKEVKSQEYRVGLIPSSVKELVLNGHQVLLETGAGKGIGLSDKIYEQQGATIVTSAQEVYQQAHMIVKVKEPQASEYPLLRENQILFTYLHLAPNGALTKALLNSQCIAIAYETVTCEQSTLPLLAPMSEVAGRVAIQAGATALEKSNGGSGVLLSGLPGVSPGRVLIIGGGVVGLNAAFMAMGLRAHVTIIDKNINRLRQLDAQFGNRLTTLYATHHTIEKQLLKADLIIGAVLVPGDSPPKLVTRKMLKSMNPGSVLVDVAIDQGGCFETSHPTTHESPTYIMEDIVHYCVTNMPSSVARTSAYALNNATLPYILDIAHKGYKKALLDNKNFMNGLNVYKGNITQERVARTLGYNYVSPLEVL